MEENHYYPFGLKHQKYYPETSVGIKAIDESTARPGYATSTPYNYKYNGKEFQDELGLNMYAMDMRQYDPAIARWVVMDPVIHHSMSPYNAFDNNPVFWADPSGADSNIFPDSMANFGEHQMIGNAENNAKLKRNAARNPSKPEQYAALANHSYSAKKGNTVSGWKVENVTDQEGKGQSGYRSALYSKNGKYVLAFAGTDPGSMADIKTDIQSIVSGESEQFETAVRQAENVVRQYGLDNVEFTGHSLGGGLASAASLATGGGAITFNALGLSDTLKGNLGILSGDSSNINAYIVSGEAVDVYQSTVGLRAEGNRTYLRGPWHFAAGGPAQRIMLHMMGVLQPILGNYIDKQIENYKKIKN